jgi:putative transposase
MKRVRLVRRADGYYCQFLISIDVQIKTEPTNKTIGLDVGLSAFYTDDQGKKVDHPKFLRTGEKKIKRLQRQVSRKQKGSNNRKKARQQLAKSHLKISRQRKEFCKRVAYSVIHSNDVVAYEDLRIKNLIKNHTHPHPLLGGEPEGWVNDAAWYQFRVWLEYFGRKYGKVTIAVPPQYTSQNCSNCGKTVKKSLSTRTHVCSCGCQLDRDENAAKNILRRGLSTAGHTGTFGLEPINALGELTSTLTGAILLGQVDSLNKESPVTSLCD